MVTPLRDILKSAARQWGLEPAARLAHARRIWHEIVGPGLAAVSAPVGIRGRCLRVGVINPAAANRRSFWTGDSCPRDPEAWLAQAREQGGSWWPMWSAWLEKYQGGRREAPTRTGSDQHPAIEPAPGRYVKQRAAPA